MAPCIECNSIIKVYIEKKAFEELTHIKNKYIESGGILLGYFFKDSFHVKEVVYSVDTKKSTKYDFVLDIDEAIKKFEYLKDKYSPSLDVIGFWHCHLTECLSLSKKDKEGFVSISKEFDYNMITILVNTVPYVGIKVFHFNGNSKIKELQWNLCS